MDPITGIIALGIISAALGGGGKAVQEIMQRKKEKRALGPDKANFPKKTKFIRPMPGSKNWTITEPGKPSYLWTPPKDNSNPIKFSDETVKQIDNLPANQRSLVNSIIGVMQADPDSFFSSIDNISPDVLQQVAQGKYPSGEELGFPATDSNMINQLMGDTDFSGIEQNARKQFNEQTIPSISERFAGLGGINSTAFKGELGRAGSNLESQLAGLRSQYGLQRANTLGGLAQKQQALDVGRAQAIGNLGLAQQGQQFGQQQALANLGLQNNQQQLSQQQQQQNLLSSLLGLTRYDSSGVKKNPGVFDYALGGGLNLLGTGAQGYINNQQNNNLIKQLNELSKQ